MVRDEGSRQAAGRYGVEYRSLHFEKAASQERLADRPQLAGVAATPPAPPTPILREVITEWWNDSEKKHTVRGLGLAAAVGVVESVIARLRLTKVPYMLITAFAFSALALIFQMGR